MARTAGLVVLLAAVLCSACDRGESMEGLISSVGSQTAIPASPSITVATAKPATALPTTPTPAIPVSVRCEWVAVRGIDDGDTFRIAPGDAEEDRVRLIGVDAPEGGKALAGDAAEALTALVGDRVCLEADTTDRDRFGRLLRYAWTPAGTLVNEAMVAMGLAFVVTYPPDTRYLASRYEPGELQQVGCRPHDGHAGQRWR